MVFEYHLQLLIIELWADEYFSRRAEDAVSRILKHAFLVSFLPGFLLWLISTQFSSDNKTATKQDLK